MALTPTQFYAYSGKTSADVNINYLAWLLSDIDEIIEDRVGALFSLSEINDGNPDYQEIIIPGNNMDLVMIGAWQSISKVEKGVYGQTTANITRTELLVDRDYTLKYYRDRFLPSKRADNPIYAVQLVNFRSNAYSYGYSNSTQAGASLYQYQTTPYPAFQNKIRSNEFIAIQGVYGWSNGMPNDMEKMIYQIILDKLQYNDQITANRGKGVIKSEKSLSLSFTYDNANSEDVKKLAYDITSHPQVAGMLEHYSNYALTSLTIA